MSRISALIGAAIPKFVGGGVLLLLLAGCGSMGMQPGSGAVQERAAKVSEAMVGAPYRWGGESPAEGFDCSGLVWYAYRQVGVGVPRTAREQYENSTPVARERMAAGDLLFFRLPKADAPHVGIYLGGQKFVHAASTGKTVKYGSFNDPFWRTCPVEGRRVQGADRRELAGGVADASGYRNRTPADSGGEKRWHLF